MPSKSDQQRRFMGAVLSYLRGRLPNASEEVIKAAEGMTEDQVKDFLRLGGERVQENPYITKKKEEK